MEKNTLTVWILDDEWHTHELEKEIYSKHNIKMKVTKSDTLKEDFDSFGRYADGIVAQVGFTVNESIISRLNNCKIIAASGVGYDHIDIEAATKKGIYVTHLPDYCIGEVSDHTIALALAVALRLRAYNEQVRKGRWDPLDTLPIHRLQNRTVGLLGFGRIAREVAKKFKAFGVNIIAHDKYVNPDIFEQLHVERVSLDELLHQSHILSIHVPLTEETKGLLNYERLMRLPKGAILVNTSRGAVVNENDLIKVIKEGHIAGAGLDVLSEEPPNKHLELLHMDEVFVTPHSSYVSVESEYELRSRTSLNVIRAINGEVPEFALNNKDK